MVGPAADADRIPDIDVALGEGEEYALGGATARVFDTPGHTRGHISYYFPASAALFPGERASVCSVGAPLDACPPPPRCGPPPPPAHTCTRSLSPPNHPPGDTLFSLGCGRLFEGTPAQMWTSLSKLLALPADTRVYCGARCLLPRRGCGTRPPPLHLVLPT